MSPEQFQYIWRKTIPHIEVGMGSGVFTSHRSARGLSWFPIDEQEGITCLLVRVRNKQRQDRGSAKAVANKQRTELASQALEQTKV